MRKLNAEEVSNVSGGVASPWYWVGYAVGAALNALEESGSQSVKWRYQEVMNGGAAD